MKKAVVIDENTPKIISTGYTPRLLQAQLHLGVKRFTTIVCHRRFGKSVWAINHLIDAALRSKLPNPRYAYIAPTYGQAKRIAWDYLKLYTGQIPGIEYNEADLRIEIPHNKSRLILLSAENPNSLAIFLGTPKGQNHFHQNYEYGRDSGDPEWASFMFKAEDTGIIAKEELDSARRTMTEEEYNQEYACDFNAGLVGAYFAKELTAVERDGRLTKVPSRRPRCFRAMACETSPSFRGSAPSAKASTQLE